jgi:hypothetical protein
MASKAYPKVIQNKINDIGEERRKALKLIIVAGYAEQLAEEIPELVQGVSVNTWFDEHVSLAVYPKTITELAKFLRRLSKRGHRIKEINDSPSCGTRTYTLDKSLRVTAHFGTSDGEHNSKQCRYVKVGETKEVKTITTPIYELQYDD